MACQITPPIYSCPYIDKLSVQKLQNALVAGCDFFQQVYGIVEVGYREGEKKVKYPRLYVGTANKNGYINLSPENDKLGRHTYCFFEVEDNERVKFDLVADGLINFRLNLIVWAKMDGITTDKLDITDYLIVKVKEALRSSYIWSDLTRFEVERDKMKVFNKYDYPFELLRNIAWPFTCFKIVMDVNSTIDISKCINEPCFALADIPS